MGIDCKGMVMKWVLAALLVASVMGASPEEELDKLALHVEHYPHAQGSNHAIYQFQIDNNNKDDKPTEAVDFTAEISPDMDVTNAYFFKEKSGQTPQKESCKVGQRSPASQEKISKKFPGAKITFPKLIRCKISHIDEFATIYVHAKVPEHKELPLNELVKASYSQRGVEGNQIEIPALLNTAFRELLSSCCC